MWSAAEWQASPEFKRYEAEGLVIEPEVERLRIDERVNFETITFVGGCLYRWNRRIGRRTYKFTVTKFDDGERWVNVAKLNGWPVHVLKFNVSE